MKRIFNILLVILLLTTLLMPGFAKDSLYSWLNRMPGYGDKRGLYWDWGVYSTYDDHQLYSIKISTTIDNIVPKCDTWQDLPAISTVSVFSLWLTTAQLALGTTYFELDNELSSITQLPYPCCVTAAYLTLGATNIAYGDVTFTGYAASGERITATIISSGISAANCTNKPFASISRIAIGAITTPQNSIDVGRAKTRDLTKLQFNVGMTTKIGFVGMINASTDYYKLTVSYTDISGSVTVNGTYGWWQPTQEPDGIADYKIYYKANSGVGDGF